MKRIVLLVGFLAAMTLCASGQTYINFHEMPIASSPTLMPDNYPSGMNMYWNNFYYVTPGIWTGEGPGFWVDPSTQHNTVVFMGGPLCALATPCTASIKLTPPNTVYGSFSPMNITLSAGWLPSGVTVLAYNNSTFVGSLRWQLTTTPQTFTFPAAWRVTQLVFTPDVIPANTVNPNVGSVVIYNFNMMMN